jgi:hypothetical protein
MKSKDAFMNKPYTTPLAKWARILEIFVPIYMFGKSWGMSDEKTLDLFYAVFPRFLVKGAQFVKGMFSTNSEVLDKFIATYAGTLIGVFVVCLLAFVMHFVLSDRKYIDSLRFTSITLLPIAVMNGCMSHVIKTYLENVDTASASVEALEKAVVVATNNFFWAYFVFYLLALWLMGRRTGVFGWRRWSVVVAGLVFMVGYVQCGLLIDAGEWAVLAPKLMEALH